jgi:alpha-beta hydrolase superfamily lysophospholipase
MTPGALNSENEAAARKMTMHFQRSESIDNLAFTAAVTIASQSLFLRDKILRRMKPAPLNDPHLEISRRPIASDNQLLDAVFVAPASEPVRAGVLLCHGIGETVDHWFEVQKRLAAAGVASLVFDYAGYGKSSGRIRWKQCEEDTIEAFGTLKALLSDFPISLLGFSLGSGIAAAVLDRITPEKLILCSSFTSFQAAAGSAGLPRWLASLAPPIWDTESSLRRSSLPVLILHCEKDRLFPTQMASDLAASCKTQPKLVIVSGQKHNDPFYQPHRRYWDHVVAMLVSDHSAINECASVSEETN